MKNITQLKHISIKKITAFCGIVGLLITLPVSIWLVQKETKLKSSAYFEKPNPIETNAPIYGDLPQEQPEITLVWPFLGKPGDSVLIYGTNFGNNPENKALIFGTHTIDENNILRWELDLIEFLIPNMNNGTYFEPISINVGNYKAEWEYPFTVYSLDTKIQISKPNRSIVTTNAPLNGVLEIYLDNGQKTKRQVIENLTIPDGNNILTIVLMDVNNQPIPFYVDPIEFEF